LKYLRKYKIAGFVLFLCFCTLIHSDECFSDDSVTNNSRNEKVKEACDQDPTSPNCQKFLDGKYRRHTDSVHDGKEELSLTIPDEQRYEEELKREFRTFCRKEPNAFRCQKKGSSKRQINFNGK